MTNTVTVRLQTLCGCTQFRVVQAPAPGTIVVPIAAEQDLNGVVGLRTRLFRRVTDTDYTEVPEAA